MMLKPLLALAILAPLASALSNDQIATVFGTGATGLTGNSIQLPQFVLTVVTNASMSRPSPGTTALVLLTNLGPQRTPWSR